MALQSLLETYDIDISMFLCFKKRKLAFVEQFDNDSQKLGLSQTGR